MFTIGIHPRRLGLFIGPRRRADDCDDIDPLLRRKGKIPLIVRGHPHHSAFTVAHQDIICDPDLNGLLGERM